MEGLEIKKVTLEDIDELQALSKQTFVETYASGNTADNMTRYLQQHFSQEKLALELAHPGAAFYFALLHQTPVGYLKLNKGTAQTELQDPHALEIERIYVLQAFRGQQVGQRLYEYAVQVAKAQNADYIWLGVWEKNENALRFYRKNGFVAFDKHFFVLGDDAQTDIMMKLMLKDA